MLSGENHAGKLWQSRSESGPEFCLVFRDRRVVAGKGLSTGFKSNLTPEQDPEYTQFKNTGPLLDKYFRRLVGNTPKTLEIYEKNYDYGCFEALLLQQYFEGWQKEIESGSWLDLVLRKNINLNESDSLQSIRRFDDIYQIGSLREKHSKIINRRDDTYRMFQAREGQTYVISFKPISHYVAGNVDKTKTNYKLGLIEMYPDGIGAISFDGVSLDLKPVPVEINQLYYIKVIDTDPKKSNKPYSIDFQSKDKNKIYHNVTITTPVFTLKAPKVMVRERAGSVKFIVMSRT